MGKIPSRAKRKLRPFPRSVRTKTSRNSPLFRHKSEGKAASLTINSQEFPYVVFQRQNKGISCCRLPRGRRGLKFHADGADPSGVESPPARETWIEIPPAFRRRPPPCSRLPRGRRGLKSRDADLRGGGLGRLPRGRRGLKLFFPCDFAPSAGRLPRGRRGLKSRPGTPVRRKKRRLPRGRRGLK